MNRDEVAAVLRTHRTRAFNGLEVLCGCGDTWRTTEEQAVHVADALADPCPSRSHGVDGWHCAVTGPHDEHLNAAGFARWWSVTR